MLDYAIASLHVPCFGTAHTEAENTQAMINAVQNPYVKILGHPDDSRYPIDQEAVVLAFALTINNMGLGISGSITGLPIPVTCLFTFLCSLLFIAVSQVAGKSCIAYFIHKYARDTAAWMIILLGILECCI